MRTVQPSHRLGIKFYFWWHRCRFFSNAYKIIVISQRERDGKNVYCNRRTDTYSWMCVVVLSDAVIMTHMIPTFMHAHRKHIQPHQVLIHHTLTTNIINGQYVSLKCLFDGYGIKFYDFMRDDVHYVHRSTVQFGRRHRHCRRKYSLLCSVPSTQSHLFAFVL